MAVTTLDVHLMGTSNVACVVSSQMLRRETYGASREMALNPSMMHDSLMNMLGVDWPNGASTATGIGDSSYKVDVDREVMTAPPPPPNVLTCTVPLLGRVQVIFLEYYDSVACCHCFDLGLALKHTNWFPVLVSATGNQYYKTGTGFWYQLG